VRATAVGDGAWVGWVVGEELAVGVGAGLGVGLHADSPNIAANAATATLPDLRSIRATNATPSSGYPAIVCARCLNEIRRLVR
jgi:hypothetical protein